MCVCEWVEVAIREVNLKVSDAKRNLQIPGKSFPDECGAMRNR